MNGCREYLSIWCISSIENDGENDNIYESVSHIVPSDQSEILHRVMELRNENEDGNGYREKFGGDHV